MARNFGLTQINATQNVTRPATIGGNPSPASHYGALGTRADLRNSFAGATTPCAQQDLAIVVGGRSFIRPHEHQLDEVQPVQSHPNDREFAACVFWCAFVTLCVAVPLATAIAMRSFG